MRKSKWIALLFVFALVAAACSDDDGGGDTTVAAGGGDTTEATTVSDIAGTEISVFAAPTGDEGQSLQGTFDVWNAQTGAIATYEGSDSFEEQLRIRVDGGNPPDVAITPQPGSICTFADNGDLVSFEDMGFDIDELFAAHGQYFMNLGLCADGEHYAIPTNANYKSLVWYNKPVFEASGYTIPETWDDLVALSSEILADGITPWCIGFGSDAATGWIGTDWIEDILVRQAGSEFYAQWYNHEVPFDSQEVKDAFATFEEIMFADDFVLGGPSEVPAIDFRDAPNPMFNDPPSCMLHRQASFIATFFPEGVVSGTDADFFAFPSIDGVDGAMGGGELAIVFNDRPEVRQFVADYAGTVYQCVQASTEAPGSDLGGHGKLSEGNPIERISANANTPSDCYQSDTVKKQAVAIATALGANTFVFDGSDLMPAEVGQGTFWDGMVDWARGSSFEDVVSTIEASWPAG
ncbi:MAG: ABC transporter substrate-binding protein [Acidimicrobiia bacterium]|nr:ABC transporter substrate-binding protein [Acidimicrobiia bacterium]